MRRILKLADGSFVPAFSIIQLDADIDFQDFESNDEEIKGTFIHEYCHFLQDVSTTYGYINFVYGLQELLLKINVLELENLSDVSLNRNYYGLYRGEDEIESGKNEVNWINEIEITPHEYLIGDYPEQDIESVKITYDGNKTFYFGNYCVAESMAYLVEKRLYNIRKRYNEFPYNICELICQKEYPEFAQNDIYIMALCELALLEMKSGNFFIKALRLMKENGYFPRNILEMEKFIDSHFSIGFRGYRGNLAKILSAVYPGEIEEFKNIKEWLLSRFEQGYKLRERSKMFISLCLCLEDKRERFGMWQQLIDDFGCPIVLDSTGTMYEGGYLHNKSIDLRYMLGPWIIGNMLAYDGKYKDRACPLSEMCGTNTSKYTSLCEKSTKEKMAINNDCFLGLFWKIYDLNLIIATDEDQVNVTRS